MSPPSDADLKRIGRHTAARRTEMTLAAAHLFHQRGYHSVTVADVAAEVGMTGPAIYRYFGNKQGLLIAAIRSGLDLIDECLPVGRKNGLPNVIRKIARVILHRKDLWAIYQREARHLDRDSRRTLVDTYDELLGRFTVYALEARTDRSATSADLPISACLAVLASPSIASVAMPFERYCRELSEIALRVVLMELPSGERGRSTPRDQTEVDVLWAVGREGEMLAAATHLFQDRGYRSVGIDDIAAQVGIAGPSIYHHFPNKADLLARLLDQATELLARNRRNAIDSAPTPGHQLHAMVRGYVELAVRHRELFDVYITEVMNLPPRGGRAIAAAIRSDVEAWTQSLSLIRPELDTQSVLLRTQAARAVIHDLIRVGQLHARPTFADDVDRIAMSILFD